MTRFDYYYMHNDYGYIVTYAEMIDICREEYDVGDPTNPNDWRDYFTRTDLLVGD